MPTAAKRLRCHLEFASWRQTERTEEGFRQPSSMVSTGDPRIPAEVGSVVSKLSTLSPARVERNLPPNGGLRVDRGAADGAKKRSSPHAIMSSFESPSKSYSPSIRLQTRLH